MIALLALAALAAIALAAAAPRSPTARRWGWLDNPTPANWWLTARDGERLIGPKAAIRRREWTGCPT